MSPGARASLPTLAAVAGAPETRPPKNADAAPTAPPRRNRSRRLRIFFTQPRIDASPKTAFWLFVRSHSNREHDTVRHHINFRLICPTRPGPALVTRPKVELV